MIQTTHASENGSAHVFLRNSWYVAAFSEELGAGFLARRLLDERVVMFRASDGKIAVLEDRCPHRLVPLSAGVRVGDTLQCGYHGTVVAADGSCVKIPGQATIPATSSTRAYPAIDRYGLIWIWTGAAHLADPALVPDLHWLAEPECVSATGYVHFNADYRLVTDNLLDLSHETYVHQSTIGNRAEESIANFRATVTTQDGRRVFCRRDMPDIETPPMWAATGNMGNRIDRLQIASYAPPGVNMTEAGFRAAGEAGDYAMYLRVMHLLTPETAHSTHYFFTSTRNYRIDDGALTKLIADGTQNTFDEDKFILELQQQSLLERGDDHVPKMVIALDGGPIQGRRVLAAAIAREQADPNYVAEPLHFVKNSAKVGSEREPAAAHL